MGEIHSPARVLLLVAATSRYDEALAWARRRWEENFGPIVLASELFAFTETDYYASTMGPDLQKQFFAAGGLVDPECLAETKCRTNAWEEEYAGLAAYPEQRPLNLDPGYITPAKLVLASTKDHAHRLYLQRGIYAEVTLAYRQKKWQPLDWTYPDYRRADYQAFFDRCREITLRA